MNLAAYESKKEICKQLWYGKRFPSEQLNMSTSWQPPSFTTASTYNCLWCTHCLSTGCQEPKRPEGCGKGYSRHLKAKIRILLLIIPILPKSSPPKKSSQQHQSSNTLVKDFRTVTLGGEFTLRKYQWSEHPDSHWKTKVSSPSALQFLPGTEPIGCLERVQFVHTRHEVFGQQKSPSLLVCPLFTHESWSHNSFFRGFFTASTVLQHHSDLYLCLLYKKRSRKTSMEYRENNTKTY